MSDWLLVFFAGMVCTAVGFAIMAILFVLSMGVMKRQDPPEEADPPLIIGRSHTYFD